MIIQAIAVIRAPLADYYEFFNDGHRRILSEKKNLLRALGLGG